MRKIKGKTILFFILYVVMFEGILINSFHIPGIIMYMADILLVFLIIYSIKRNKKLGKEEKVIRNIVGIYMLIVMFAYILNYQNILYFVGGFRNIFRFFLFFFVCTIYLTKSYMVEFFKNLDAIFYINAAIMMIQYFIFGLNQDYLGGIFGTHQGCNGPLNIFFVVIVSYSVLAYMNKKESLNSLIIKCGLALTLAGLAELKYFYIEFVIIVIFAFLTTGFTLRKLSLVVFSIAGLAIGIKIIEQLFGMGYVFNVDFIIKDSTSGGYTSTGDLSRGAFITAIEKGFLDTIGKKLFGLGLGNCESRTIFADATPFYLRYRALHYDWFASMHTFLEQGWCGLLFYVVFFLMIAVSTFQISKRYNIDLFYIKLTYLYTFLFFLVFFYNQTLRQDIAYLVAFCLAISFVSRKDKNNKRIVHQVLYPSKKVIINKRDVKYK